MVSQVSSAASALCVWVHAIYLYANVAKDVAPKRARLKEAQVRACLLLIGGRLYFHLHQRHRLSEDDVDFRKNTALRRRTPEFRWTSKSLVGFPNVVKRLFSIFAQGFRSHPVHIARPRRHVGFRRPPENSRRLSASIGLFRLPSSSPQRAASIFSMGDVVVGKYRRLKTILEPFNVQSILREIKLKQHKTLLNGSTTTQHTGSCHVRRRTSYGTENIIPSRLIPMQCFERYCGQYAVIRFSHQS